MSSSPPVDVSGRALALRDVDLDRFLHPRTVAVIGASEASRKPNTAMTRKIKGWADAHGATFYPVHPTHETVLGELHATRNWRRLAMELWPFTQGPPSTPLGEEEARWLAATGAARKT